MKSGSAKSGLPRLTVRLSASAKLCGDRTFVSLVVCMKRECVRPELAQHAECQRLATLETPQPQP